MGYVKRAPKTPSRGAFDARPVRRRRLTTRGGVSNDPILTFSCEVKGALGAPRVARR